MKVTLKNVRLAFPALFEPKTVGGSDALRFSAAFPVEPDSANAKALDAALVAVAKEKWGDKASAIFKKLKQEGRVCFDHAPLTNGEGDVYDGFDGMYSVNATSKSRPTLVDRDRSPVTEADGKLYGGCYVNAIIDVWPQDNQYGKRLNAQLQGVQFVKDGDAFGGGGAASADEFDELEPLDVEGDDDFA